MAQPTGESESDALRLDFDQRLKLEFHGSNVIIRHMLCKGALAAAIARPLLATHWDTRRAYCLVDRHRPESPGFRPVAPDQWISDLRPALTDAEVCFVGQSGH
jgi:hypothetical protein